MAQNSIEVNKMLLPNMDINKNVGFSFYETPQSISYRQYNSNDVSQTSLSWSITPPSPSSSILNKRVLKQYDVLVSITGTAPVGQYIYNDELLCPRMLPMSSVTQSETVTFNSSFSNSLNVSDVLSTFARYDSSYEQLGFEFAYTPSQLDNCALADQMKGTTNSPFNTFNDQVFGVQPRNAIPKKIESNPISTGVPATAQLRYRFVEPVLVSPFSVDDSSNDEKGFANIQSLEINETFTNDLTRIFLQANTLPAGRTITNITVLIERAVLLAKWYTLPPNIRPDPVIDYSYNIVDIYTTNINGGSSVPASTSASLTVNSNGVEFKRIPQLIFHAIRPSNNSRTRLQADYFCPINNISISYEQVDNQLQNANEIQLYEICRKNGLKSTSFAQSMMGTYNSIDTYSASTVTSYIGTSNPVCLSIPDDIYLQDGHSVGVAAVSQFQSNITYKNLIASPLTLYIICVTPAVFKLSLSEATTISSSFLTADMNLSMPYVEPDPDQMVGSGLYGGKFRLGRSLGRFVKDVERGAKQAYKIGKKALPYVEKGLKYAADADIPGAQLLSNVYGDVKREISGGRMLSNADKMAMVRAYKRNYIR